MACLSHAKQLGSIIDDYKALIVMKSVLVGKPFVYSF